MSILKKQSCWLSKCWNTCTQPWAKNLGYISLSCVTIFFNHWPILRTLWALVAKSGKLTEQYYEVDRDFHTVTFSEGPSAVWAGVVCVCASLRTIVSNALVCLHNPQSDRIHDHCDCICVLTHIQICVCYRFSSARVISDDIVVSHPALPRVSNSKRQLQECGCTHSLTHSRTHTHEQGH